jgi:ribose 5-phosphate isomerase
MSTKLGLDHVENGLFIRMASEVIVGNRDGSVARL